MARALAPELLPLLRQPAVLSVDPQGRPAQALPPLFEALEREVRGDVGAVSGAGGTGTQRGARDQQGGGGEELAAGGFDFVHRGGWRV